MSVHSQGEVDAIALQLNMPLRKRFDFRCPIEVMGEVMQKAMAMRHDDYFNSITVLHSAPATTIAFPQPMLMLPPLRLERQAESKLNRPSAGCHV